MTRARTAFVLLSVILTLMVAYPALSGTVFGPQQYMRTGGAPDTYTDTFQATGGAGSLIIKNGDIVGDNRVDEIIIDNTITSARVSLNGIEIFGPSDFKNSVYSMEQSVTLIDGTNTLTVELSSTPGSYITAEVTGTVISPPTVGIDADPESIQTGGSSVLSWTTTNAATCTIDQGIGDVPVNGSLTVSPTQTTTYTITATGIGGGTQTDSVTVTVTNIPSMTLDITSPSDGATLSVPYVNVQGTVTNTSGAETGVVVNGVIAGVYGDQFTANHIPLQEGQNTITVTATDVNGTTATESITVNVEATGGYIQLTADTESGAAPLETTLKVTGTFGIAGSFITYTGPGKVEFLENPIENTYTVKMTTPGVYYFTAEVTDTENNTYTDTVAIQVIDVAELDAILRTKWEGMRQALAQSDIATATSYVADSKKGVYQSIFTALSSKLPQISQELGDIQFIRMIYNAAEYDIRTTRDGNEYSYYLLFVKDQNGLWKIRSF